MRDAFETVAMIFLAAATLALLALVVLLGVVIHSAVTTGGMP